MTLHFPSPEFDDAVAGVCHGRATLLEMRALNGLLRGDPRARDEYLLRVALHTRLASDPNLYASAEDPAGGWHEPEPDVRTPATAHTSERPAHRNGRRGPLPLALAACLVIAATGLWVFWSRQPGPRNGSARMAVAMLTRTVEAQWADGVDPRRAGSPLDPGWLRLASGMAQIVFYSGARVVIEGPAEVRLVSPREVVCRTGRLLAEVPEPARGFRVRTDHLDLVDLGTSFGLDTTCNRTEVHVFKGKVKVSGGKLSQQTLSGTQAAVVQGSAPPRLMAADARVFTPRFDFQQRSLALEALRYEEWQFASARLNQDPSLLVRFDLQGLRRTDWSLRNTAANRDPGLAGVIVGCTRGEGRWPEKAALEFQSVNDRVRMAVPGEFDSLTLAAWVCLFGLDRQLNSLFMCDGFAPGTLHWLVRHDGVLGVTVFGDGPGRFQILPSPPVIALEQLGRWRHFAVVLDGRARRVVQYLDGSPSSRHALAMEAPFRVSAAEFGNWNAQSGPEPAPALIRNLSGALDEFALFSRALREEQIRRLYLEGKP